MLRIENLSFSWHPERPLLDIPHLHLERGEKLFLRGPSGSGKSSLLGLIGGVLHAQRGSILIQGSDIQQLGRGARDRFRADHIGLVFQQFNLLPYLSALENVLLALAFSPRRRGRLGTGARAEARQLLLRLQLDGATLDGPAAELSVGQQQRVAAARALIGAPELIIADEPTSALDEDTRERFLSLLFDECALAQTALLFVSHDRSLEARFDRSLELGALNRARAVPA